jgi:hypothetical protein
MLPRSVAGRAHAGKAWQLLEAGTGGDRGRLVARLEGAVGLWLHEAVAGDKQRALLQAAGVVAVEQPATGLHGGLGLRRAFSHVDAVGDAVGVGND